jgi:succinyl-CoA synthetase beta subunit
MKIHEYQAKALLKEFGIPVPKGNVALKPSEVKEIATDLGGKVVIKAQVYAGGRGKAGGIKIANTPNEAKAKAEKMLGSRLVTKQTTPSGVPINKVLVEEVLDIKRELYLSLIVDRVTRVPLMIASEDGGMEIEEVAQKDPNKILKSFIDPPTKYRNFHGAKLAYYMHLEPEEAKQAIKLMSNLYNLFITKDCSLIEINPLVITDNGDLLALDAKLNFDDNALFRHKELEELRDWDQEDPAESQAGKLGISNFVKLDGDIGCLVNGAGLTMSVVDLLTIKGGKAANFYDIGPNPQSDTIINAFRIITSDQAVKVLLLDIFAGMGKGDAYAQGIVDGYKYTNCKLPLVAKIVGTNAKEANNILAESGIDYYAASSFNDEAVKAVQLAKEHSGR